MNADQLCRVFHAVILVSWLSDNAHGMVWSVYFHGGYAVHGYPSVPPTYPASHGCLRVPIPDSHHIYSSVRLGETIYVYD